MEGYFLFGKGLGPFIRIFFVDLDKLRSVVSHGLPFRTILGSFWQMHFFAHEIRASEHDADTQGIRTVTFSKLRNQARKVSLIDRIPWDGNRHCSASIRAMGIHYASFKRLTALLVNKRRRIKPSFYAELVFHSDVAEHCYGFVDRAEIQMTGLLLDVFPTDVQAYAG